MDAQFADRKIKAIVQLAFRVLFWFLIIAVLQVPLCYKILLANQIVILVILI